MCNSGRDQVHSLAALMQRYAAGDAAAYETLYACVAPRVRREIHARVRDPRAVEDLTQVVFLRAHAGRLRYRARMQHADSALIAWFFAIACGTARFNRLPFSPSPGSQNNSCNTRHGFL